MALDWKSLFWGAGRIDRTTFWTVQLLLAVFEACLKATAMLFPSELMYGLIAPFIIASMAVGVFNLVKRLHDLGRSGWWMLLPLTIATAMIRLAAAEFGRGSNGARAAENLALLGLLALMAVIGALKGSPQPNRFGDPPKPMSSAAA